MRWMTEQEKVTQGFWCCTHTGNCLICPYDIKGGREYDENGNRCLENLINAAYEVLKAQEPVNPIFNVMVETDMSYWSCGACGAFIFGNTYPHMLPENKPKYCGYCGRAVKWNG